MIPRLTSGSLVLRKGRADDKSQVVAFTQSTFSWGDYLPRVWDHWAASRDGALIVVELDRRVVGTIRVRFLNASEAWLEGVRVHPELRGKGIGSLLVDAAHARARKHGSRVIRLETGARNFPAQRTFVKAGYRRVIEYGSYKGNVKRGTLEAVRLARADDEQMCWALWQASALNRKTDGIVPSEAGWRWGELRREHLRRAIRERRVWVTPDAGRVRGLMIVRHDDSCDVTLLVGNKSATARLLEAGRHIAAEFKRKHVYWLAPITPFVKRAAAAAGLKPEDDGLVIYACAL